MTRLAKQIRQIVVGETRNVAVDFSGALDTGELLTGTPTVVEVTTSDLSLTNKAVNTTALTIDGETVAIGMAVQFRVDASSAVAGTTYLIDITCGTDASQTVKGRVRVLA